MSPTSQREYMMQIESLRAQLAECQKDAERYRLLRRGQHWSVINGGGDTLRAESLDATIDAAMKGDTK